MTDDHETRVLPTEAQPVTPPPTLISDAALDELAARAHLRGGGGAGGAGGGSGGDGGSARRGFAPYGYATPHARVMAHRRQRRAISDVPLPPEPISAASAASVTHDQPLMVDPPTGHHPEPLDDGPDTAAMPEAPVVGDVPVAGPGVTRPDAGRGTTHLPVIESLLSERGRLERRLGRQWRFLRREIKAHPWRLLAIVAGAVPAGMVIGSLLTGVPLQTLVVPGPTVSVSPVIPRGRGGVGGEGSGAGTGRRREAPRVRREIHMPAPVRKPHQRVSATESPSTGSGKGSSAPGGSGSPRPSHTPTTGGSGNGGSGAGNGGGTPDPSPSRQPKPPSSPSTPDGGTASAGVGGGNGGGSGGSGGSKAPSSPGT